ncbi:MAG: dihydroorotate dehydrogenase [Promethearchaeota archaeon]
MPTLSINLATLQLKNPVMLAAGILGISGSMLKRVADAGAGAVVTKSIGPEPREGYDNPTVIPLNEFSCLNAVGLSNPGYLEFSKEIPEAKQGNAPIIVSTFGAEIEEFCIIAKEMEKSGADALELNLSCPHGGKYGAAIGQDPQLTGEIVNAVKNTVHIPVFVKLTPNVTDLIPIAKSAENNGADAITAINTVRAMCIDIVTGRPLLSNKFGGLSGPAIKPIAIKHIYDLYKEVEIPLIGVGGIVSWEDAIEFFLAGATAIQVGTGLLGSSYLDTFNKLNNGILSYLERKGYTRLEEIVGLTHRL